MSTLNVCAATNTARNPLAEVAPTEIMGDWPPIVHVITVAVLGHWKHTVPVVLTVTLVVRVIYSSQSSSDSTPVDQIQEQPFMMVGDLVWNNSIHMLLIDVGHRQFDSFTSILVSVFTRERESGCFTVYGPTSSALILSILSTP